MGGSDAVANKGSNDGSSNKRTDERSNYEISHFDSDESAHEGSYHVEATYQRTDRLTHHCCTFWMRSNATTNIKGTDGNAVTRTHGAAKQWPIGSAHVSALTLSHKFK